MEQMPQDIIAGDSIVMDIENGLLEEFQRGHGEFSDAMANVRLTLNIM